jgi:hypothetical protein
VWATVWGGRRCWQETTKEKEWRHDESTRRRVAKTRRRRQGRIRTKEDRRRHLVKDMGRDQESMTDELNLSSTTVQAWSTT